MYYSDSALIHRRSESDETGSARDCRNPTGPVSLPQTAAVRNCPTLLSSLNSTGRVIRWCRWKAESLQEGTSKLWPLQVLLPLHYYLKQRGYNPHLQERVAGGGDCSGQPWPLAGWVPPAGAGAGGRTTPRHPPPAWEPSNPRAPSHLYTCPPCSTSPE